MESYLCSSLNAAPLSTAAQSIIAALRGKYVPRTDRSRASESETTLEALNDRGFRLYQLQSRDDRDQELYKGTSRDLDLNRLRDVSIHERLGPSTAGDINMTTAHPYRPTAQGEDSLRMFRLTSLGSPQPRENFKTEEDRKRRWIQPASPTEEDPVGHNQHEASPVKKFRFGQLILPDIYCDPASREEGKMIDIVDTQSRNGHINPLWIHQSGLTEKDKCDSFCGGISKETSAAPAVFIEVKHNKLIYDVEKPMFENLETSHFWQNSAPVDNSQHAERVQDISVGSNEMLDYVREKEESASEIREIAESRTDSHWPDEDIVLVSAGLRVCIMESSEEHPTNGEVQNSIQPHSQAFEVKLFPKHTGKCKPPGPSQKAPKITSSQELCKRTIRSSRFPSLFHLAKVKSSVQLLRQRKSLQAGARRQSHPLRTQNKFKSQKCSKLNNFKTSKPSDPCMSGSKVSKVIQLSSETDRKDDGPTVTSRGAFSLTSDPRVCDTGRLSKEEREQMLEEVQNTKSVVVTMVYQDGTTQLDPEQKLCPAVCALLVLLKKDLDSEEAQDRPPDRVLYLRLEQTPAWAQQGCTQKQDAFTREMLLQVICGSKPFVCFKAKDLLRTALSHFRDLSWTQVLECQVMDPQIAAWLLDAADSASCFQTLLSKHWTNPVTPTSLQPVLGQAKVTQVISNLSLLHKLMVELHNKLQTRGLWQLYSGIEQKMIPVLAAMESCKMHVDKESLKKTSEMLGSKLKQFEKEAHQAAGQKFLVSSSAQLRLILFEKLHLHELCENKKLPKTIKQQQSTSETALLQLQNLHPLPKIILEYRQIHKLKTAFVDGILSCMSKTFISPTWNQTSTVSGRLSSKHPNFQALPKQPLQISKKQYIQGKLSDIVTVHPRAMFIPREGWTFLSADFCQVELRLLAHLSADPQLLRIFQKPEADAFAMLAAQWKGVSEDRVSPEGREHAKRIVYSVIYGAGRERLSGILGVSAEDASRFQDSFLQTYREVPAFIQNTIQYCQSHGFVKSIMGRRRSLPHIHSADWGLRNQAERQAVNFVLQGSAADLAKMAMIKICSQVSSAAYTARLVAQIHDELLFEVETSQLNQFAGASQSFTVYRTVMGLNV